MKRYLLVILLLLLPHSVNGQIEGTPEDTGLTPLTDTLYLNVPPETNNDETESLGVAIAANGNILVGWEDDGDGLEDLSAVWTLLSPEGIALTDAVSISSLQTPTVAAIETRFLSYFRNDGSPTPANTAWGPKIKANPFGDGLGMGATAYALGAEIAHLADINQDSTEESGVGDFPAVQLLTDDGMPVRVVTGASDTDAEPDGDIRIADWAFLSNGNIVIAGESRQENDIIDRFDGTTANRHAVYRVIDREGNEVKAYTRASEPVDARVGMWHGIGVTQNGFGLRYEKGGRSTVRLFDNNGEPITGDIDIGNLTDESSTAAGGRGDKTGFHGNGHDAYLITNTGFGPEAINQAWITVLNADGTLRYTRVAADDPFVNSDRTDGAIDPSGRVIVVFASDDATDGQFRLVHARLFDSAGEPLGPTFFVSETEDLDNAFAESRRPRVAWRQDTIAIVWESNNSPDTSNTVVATRLFSLPSANPVIDTPLTINLEGFSAILTWEGQGNLEHSATVSGPWQTVPGANSPFSINTTEPTAFYRLR